MKLPFLLFSIAVMLLSIVSAVNAYEVDTNTYRLQIATVSIEDSNTLQFYLINPLSETYSFLDMHSYSIKIKDTKTTTKFSHSQLGALPLEGKLGFGDKKLFSLPYDPTQSVAQQLECSKDVTVEMYDLRGNTVARWVGIPKCNIQTPRVNGLLKVNNCTAEYYDGTLKIKWELAGADKKTGMVYLKKTYGRMDSVYGWYDSATCPDTQGGHCMTVVSPVFWGDGNVSVTLYDKRQGTSVTLVSTDEAAGSCYKKSTVTVVTTENSEAANATTSTTASSTVTTTTSSTSSSNSSSTNSTVSVLKANDSNDVRVCLEGCKAEGQCYDEETRAAYLGMNVYCKGQDWMVQKKDGSTCSYDYECYGNDCVSGYCGSAPASAKKEGNWLTRMLQWIDDLI
ncbi:hypothetical protein KY363_05190 [Candidatus Woesearchaeota archaeon]|nr:hypothetical protein [Candidatus Woesearchaeota archaeon]